MWVNHWDSSPPKPAAPTKVWRRFASESQSGVRYRKDMNDISLSGNASVLKPPRCSEHKVYATKDVWVQGNADDQMQCAEKWVVKQKRCRYKGKLLSDPARLRQTPWFHRAPASSLTPAISRHFSLAVDKFGMTVPIEKSNIMNEKFKVNYSNLLWHLCRSTVVVVFSETEGMNNFAFHKTLYLFYLRAHDNLSPNLIGNNNINIILLGKEMKSSEMELPKHSDAEMCYRFNGS